MPCDAYRDLLHAYVDGELDPAARREVAGHLADCPACARSCEEIKALGRTLRSLLPAVALPPGLHDGVRTALRRVEVPPVPPFLGAHGLLLALLSAAALAGGAAVTIGLSMRQAPVPLERPVKQIAACHGHSVRDNPGVDVASADPVVIQQWLHDHLGFTPIIPNFPPQAEAVLVGARRDSVEQQSAAALVYRQGAHTVTFIVYPDPHGGNGPPPGLVFLDAEGYQIAHWGKGESLYWVVTDMPPAELLQFLHRLGQATPPYCHW